MNISVIGLGKLGSVMAAVLADKGNTVQGVDVNPLTVEAIKELTQGDGAHVGCECVGWQAHDPEGHEHPNMVMNRLDSLPTIPRFTSAMAPGIASRPLQ